MYICYLNGEFYGAGDREYMSELFSDYVTASDMYGNHDCEFRIVRVTNENMKETLLKNGMNYKIEVGNENE